jgi:type II secretory pathway component PulF
MASLPAGRSAGATRPRTVPSGTSQADQVEVSTEVELAPVAKVRPQVVKPPVLNLAKVPPRPLRSPTILHPGRHIPGSLKHTALFYRQLGALIKAGLTLPQALIHASGTGGARYKALGPAWADWCTHGNPLWEGMAADGEAPVRVALIRAGEHTGTLPELCSRIADHLDQLRTMRDLAISKLIYPLVLVHAVMIIPRFPALIQGAIEPWQLLVPPALLWICIIGGLILARVLGGSGLFAHLALLPGPRALFRPYLETNACLVLGNALAAGLRVREALDLTALGCGNSVMAARLRGEGERIERGETLDITSALRNVGFSELTTSLVLTGEQSGKLEKTLDQAGILAHEAFKSRMEWTVKAITSACYATAIILIGMAILNMASQYIGMVSGAASSLGE